MATPPPPPAYPNALPPRKGLSPWVYIAAVIGGLVILAGIAVVATGIFVAGKVKEASKNPVAAMAKIATMANPNIEVLEADESTGKVVVRDKSSGKTVTMNMDDLKNGRFQVKTEDGSASFGANVDVKLPSWIPVYPGSKQTGVMSSQTSEADTGIVQLETPDSIDKVKSFYEEQFKSNGMNTNSNVVSTPGGAVISAGKNDGKDEVNLVLTREGDATHATITYKTRK